MESGPPRLGPFFPRTQCSATPSSKRHGQNEVRKLKTVTVIVEGKERKVNHAALEAAAKGKTMGQNAGEARFPLSTTIEREDGRKSQISQQCGRSWQPPQFPAELPQINIRAEGTDLLLSKISKLCTRVERKQEGSRGRRRRRRGMFTSRQVRWETSQPLTRN